MSEQLLPCPFCGGSAEFERRGSERHSCIVVCTNCGCRNEANEADWCSGQQWNTRTPRATPPTGEQAALDRLLDDLQTGSDDDRSVAHACQVELDALHTRLARIERANDQLRQVFECEEVAYKRVCAERDTLRASLAAARAQAFEEAAKMCDEIAERSNPTKNHALGWVKSIGADDCATAIRAASEGGRT